MKKFLEILSAAVALTSFAATAQAQIVTSVQFNGDGAQPLHGTYFDYTAGAYLLSGNPVGDWNVELSTGNTTTPQSLTITSGLMTSTGSASTIGFTLNSSGAYYSGAGGGFTSSPPYPGYPGQDSGPGDAFLYGSLAYAQYSDSNPLTLSVTGLDTTHTYDILVYVTPFQGFGAQQTANLNLAGGPTYYITTDGSAGTYEKITSTTSGSPTTGNYVEFDGLTGATSQALTFNNTGTLDGVSGFQVIDLGAAAPEPTSAWLILAGFAGLGVYLRRKHLIQA